MNIRRLRMIALLLTCILAGIASSAINGACFRHTPFEQDGISYLFQAKLFSQGRLFAAPPLEFGLTASEHININNNKWYSKYAPGHALMLVPGVMIDAPWIIPALLTSLTLLLIFLLVKEAYGIRTAGIAAALAFFSPTLVGLGATLYSETTSRCFLALYFFMLFKTLKTRSLVYALISGSALGFAYITRPPSAILCAVTGVAFSTFWVLREKDRSVFLKPFCAFFLAWGIFFSLSLAWNAYFTGSPIKSTFNLMQPYDSLGFGKRENGYSSDASLYPSFTQSQALIRSVQKIPAIGVNLLGTGYLPTADDMSSKNKIKTLLTHSGIGVLPVLLLYLLACLPFFSPKRNRYDTLFLSLLPLYLGLYFFYYADYAYIGNTPIHVRYYTEPILLGIIPLIARGITLAHDRIRPMNPLQISAALLLLLTLGTNSFFTYHRTFIGFSFWHPYFMDLPRLVKEHQVHHAVIFLDGYADDAQSAPLGEYPFVSLEKVDIAYFKLGPAPRYNFEARKWQEAYTQYFRGRKAYLYTKGTLVPLDPGTIESKP